MNHYIATLYLLASIAGVIAMYPQIKQLLITKESDELSLTTWIVWGSYQVIALIYSISIHAVPFMINNVAWVSFYATIIYLIIKYRKAAPKQELAESAVSPDQNS